MLLWFRNDLRVHDNPALFYFLQQHWQAYQQQGEMPQMRALFFISHGQWLQHRVSDIKIDLILRHVDWLERELGKLGVRLEVVECDNFQQQVDYLGDYCREHNIRQVVVNDELEVNERARDRQLTALGIELLAFECDVIVPKGKLVNQDRQMFKVFTPFKKAWLKYVRQNGFDYIAKDKLSPFSRFSLEAGYEDGNEYRRIKYHTGLSDAWPLVDEVERRVIPEFLEEKLESYHELRDIPAIKGTSGLSPYLAIGALSPRYLLCQLINQNPDVLNAHDSPNFAWLNELIWREFYRHLMHHFPSLAKGKNFRSKYDSLVWSQDKALFKLWCQGRTGYPIVDAAMRQLNKTGWMHNRLRMIVASFLTKHLLIDWRWGENYFMESLIDGDLAANNGGWQWAASTGCDAQPYFRIFNPVLQSKKFDPKGTFIRKYLPELNSVPDNEVHFPHDYLRKNKLDIYWPAIVDHKFARERALNFYQGA
ncbi:deoxyribodipyrimidine photo-lyase [Thalassomonas viridans]|uniref:Deoxyribodipyrimidine photo-lyase n=1 Tax=Thalassomonas viridans TaxID=137584 RepID=A0AAF0C7Y5_9GAMM|nr:deoxyribodipyrimidine photo-lyase [Thalassomonas viridans]WDE04183.1 deoxyribodipyrimidine photo-lyase [Thalassomonas viridans]